MCVLFRRNFLVPIFLNGAKIAAVERLHSAGLPGFRISVVLLPHISSQWCLFMGIYSLAVSSRRGVSELAAAKMTIRGNVISGRLSETHSLHTTQDNSTRTCVSALHIAHYANTFP